MMLSDPMTELSSELQRDEKLLWSGRPRQGVFLRSTDAVMIPMSVLWAGFAIFWEASVLLIPSHHSRGHSDPIGTIFPIFGLPFVAMGLYMLIGRFFVDSAQRRKTIYGVTNQRVIIRSGLFSRDLKSINLKTLSDVTLSEKSSGRGTITFGPSPGVSSWLAGAQWPGTNRQAAPCFDNIENAKNVYEIIRRAQSSA